MTLLRKADKYTRPKMRGDAPVVAAMYAVGEKKSVFLHAGISRPRPRPSTGMQLQKE